MFTPDTGQSHLCLCGRIEAADAMQSFVDQIVLTPVDGKVKIDVQGDLAGILTISMQSNNSVGGAGSSQVKMVAGPRNVFCYSLGSVSGFASGNDVEDVHHLAAPFAGSSTTSSTSARNASAA